MPLSHDHIRTSVDTYLARHPHGRNQLGGILDALDRPTDIASRSTFTGHVTCGAIVVDDLGRAGDRPRMGLFFRARSWAGEPELREPDKCTRWKFWDPAALHDHLVPYTRQTIAKIQNGELYSETGWPA